MLGGIIAFFSCIVLYLCLGFLTVLIKHHRGQWENDQVQWFITLAIWPLFLWASLFKEPCGTTDPSKALRGVPRCSARIVYPAKDDLNRDLSGILTFFAADAAHLLAGTEPKGYGLALKQWIAGRSESEKATGIPETLQPAFRFVARRLLDQGQVMAYCRGCEKITTPVLIHQNGQVGWNSESYVCPEGHVLFTQRTLHISSSQKVSGGLH